MEVCIRPVGGDMMGPEAKSSNEFRRWLPEMRPAEGQRSAVHRSSGRERLLALAAALNVDLDGRRAVAPLAPVPDSDEPVVTGWVDGRTVVGTGDAVPPQEQPGRV